MTNGPNENASSIDSQIQSICDIMRRSNAASALQYIPELTWILFLRVLDEREEQERIDSEIVGADFTPTLDSPYRWQDWAGPDGAKRKELMDAPSGSVFEFVTNDLFPHLQQLSSSPFSTARQRVVSEVISGTESPRIDSERNFLDVLDRVHEIRDSELDKTHASPLSQAYEGLLLKMGEKNNDGGQFFTPREVIRAIVKVVEPEIDETVFDPAAGTGGFLALAYEHIRNALGDEITATQMTELAEGTFFGKEKDNLIYPICLANLVLHGIDEPRIWHGNTLTQSGNGGGLWSDAPTKFDVVLMNPPFGGKEGTDARQRYAYQTSSTQVLFVQEVIDCLKPQGRAGIVTDEGFLFRTSERAFVQTKRKLLEECNLYCVISLPSGVFTQAGAGVNTNLLFFNKGGPTERIWYYDLTGVKVTKTKPLLLSHFDEFFELLPTRADSERSWTVSREEIESRNYDLKAVNPNRRIEVDTRTPAELIATIESEGEKIREAMARLKELDGAAGIGVGGDGRNRTAE